MYALYVPVEPLRHLLPPAPPRVGFLDVQALLGLDFYSTQQALFVLRDAGLLDRFTPHGDSRPKYAVTNLAARLLALGARTGKAVSGSIVDATVKLLEDVSLSIASLTVRQGGGAVLEITVSVCAARKNRKDLEDRLHRLVQRLEQQAALPPLRLALVQEARAALGGGG